MPKREKQGKLNLNKWLTINKCFFFPNKWIVIKNYEYLVYLFLRKHLLAKKFIDPFI